MEESELEDEEDDTIFPDLDDELDIEDLGQDDLLDEE